MHFSAKRVNLLLVLMFTVACTTSPPLSTPSPDTVSAPSDAATVLMKIAAPLRQVRQRMREDGLTAENVAAHHAERYTTPLVRVDAHGNIQAVIVVTTMDADVVSRLEAHRVRVDFVEAPLRLVQVWLPFDRLEDIAALPFIQYIRPPSYAVRR